MKSRRFSILILIVTFGVCQVTQAHSPNVRDCAERLKNSASQQQYRLKTFRMWRQKYDIQPLKSSPGYVIFSREARQPTIKKVLPSLIREPFQWRQEQWKYQDRKYRFADAGLKNLESDAQYVNRMVVNHLLEHPDSNLEISYGAIRAHEIEELHELRYTIHDLVLDTYQATKSYLEEADISILHFLNQVNTNNQVLTVFDDVAGAPWSLSSASIRKYALVTIQISYFTAQQLARPSWRGIGDVYQAGEVYATDKLPFEYRVFPSERERFRQNNLAGFDLTKSCELTRYAKFNKDVPRPVMDRLLREAFKEIRNKGIKTIFIGADLVTKRLFMRYGFKVIGKLPITGDDASDEELLYLNVDSSEFKAIYAMLKFQSMGVSRSRLNRP